MSAQDKLPFLLIEHVFFWTTPNANYNKNGLNANNVRNGTINQQNIRQPHGSSTRAWSKASEPPPRNEVSTPSPHFSNHRWLQNVIYNVWRHNLQYE